MSVDIAVLADVWGITGVRRIRMRRPPGGGWWHVTCFRTLPDMRGVHAHEAPMRLPRTLAARFSLPLFALGAVSVAGCSDFGLVGEPGGEGAPTAVLVVDAAAGQAPFDVIFDASGSTPFARGDALTFEFDPGTGTFAAGQEAPTFAFTYVEGGAFEARVRVRGPDGRFDIDTITIAVEGENPPRTADVDVDSNHDGEIGGGDDAIEAERHAAFIANVDDDNGDLQRDRQDSPLNPDDDDMTDVIVRRVRGLDGAKVFIELQPPGIARDRVRLWQGDTILLEAGKDRSEVVGVDDDDVTLRLEAMTGRTSDWDGVVRVRVSVEDGRSVVSEDVVTMRAAPVIFPDNLQAPRRLYVMDVPDGQDNNRALLAAFASLPEGVELTTTNAFAYDFDRWMQDNWEVGSQTVPVKGGVKEMITAMQHTRSYGGRGLENFVPGEWLSAGRGFFVPGGAETSHNYGGNLEVSPPTAQDPLGRMLYGGGTTTLSGARNVDTMNPEQVGFLDAQEVQGPALELSSEWLAVGHIDEVFQFVPDLSPEGPHPFKVVIASPRMARDVLLALRAEGKGSSRAFATRRNSYSVDEMLDAEQFNALNEAAQTRIDEIQARLMANLGLVDDDFRPVPVLFNEVDSGLVAAFNPGIQNLVTVGDRLFVPDPEGPADDGVDAWQRATLESLADTDLDVIFVDVFESYHELLGEAHCGTNLERAPYSTPWWTVE
jgi:hypothetical protein